MPTLQFATESGQDSDNKAVNSSRLINAYIEPIGGRSPTIMKSVLGMTLFATVPGVFSRAVRRLGDLVYVVQNGWLYQLTSAGAVTGLGNVIDSAETSLSSNDGNITIAAGGTYYVWDGSTLSAPTGGVFTDVGSVGYFGGLTVLTERNGQRVQWSDVADPKTIGGLSFATADAYDGDIVRVVTIAGSLYFFKENSIEQWYQVGADLAPLSGGSIEYGLRGYNLIAPFENGAFFVASNGKVMVMSGGAPKIISNRAVETAIDQEEPTHCFSYQDEGHEICVVRFANRPAYCYDLATGFWHERSEGEPGDAWGALGSFKAWDSWYVTTNMGPVYSLGRTNEDYGNPLIRQHTSSTLQQDDVRFSVNKLRMLARVGRADIGREAKVTLQVSRDFGETWTDPKVTGLGEVGEYRTRIAWRRLGVCRQFTARVTISDPAEIPLDNIATVEVS